jgi:hypothetical protein
MLPCPRQPPNRVVISLFGTYERTIDLAGRERLQHVGIGAERMNIDRRFAGFLQRLTGGLSVFQIDCAKINGELFAGKILWSRDRFGVLFRHHDRHRR